MVETRLSTFGINGMQEFYHFCMPKLTRTIPSTSWISFISPVTHAIGYPLTPVLRVTRVLWTALAPLCSQAYVVFVGSRLTSLKEKDRKVSAFYDAWIAND